MICSFEAACFVRMPSSYSLLYSSRYGAVLANICIVSQSRQLDSADLNAVDPVCDAHVLHSVCPWHGLRPLLTD